jgi:hypothetical protein
MPTSAALPATITPQTGARRHMRCDKPHPAQRKRHGAPAQRTPTTHTPHIAHSHTNTQAPHARTTSRTAATTPHCAIITARTPQHTCHTQRTRGLRATLTIVESGCPASTGCCRRVGYRSSTSTCRTHEQPSRHTMAPDADADPSQLPTTHRSASHNINQVKSNENQSAHCMLSLTHNTTHSASNPPNGTTRQPAGT